MTDLQDWFREGELAGMTFEVMVKDAYLAGWSGGLIIRELRVYSASELSETVISDNEIINILKRAGFDKDQRKGFVSELRTGSKPFFSKKVKIVGVLGIIFVVLGVIIMAGFGSADGFDCEKGLLEGYSSVEELQYCQVKEVQVKDVEITSNVSHTVVVVNNEFVAKWLKEVML